MNEIKTFEELKALGKEKGLLLLAKKEDNKVLDKFIKRIDQKYTNGDQVLVVRLLIDLGW